MCFWVKIKSCKFFVVLYWLDNIHSFLVAAANAILPTYISFYTKEMDNILGMFMLLAKSTLQATFPFFCKSMLTPFRVYSSGKEFRSKFIINIFPPPNWFQWPEKNLSNLQAIGILQMFQGFFADSTPFKMLVEVVAENEVPMTQI